MSDGESCHASQASAWVLGTLSDEEAARFAEHLPTCEICAPLVVRLREVVDALPDSVRQDVPPAELRERIMSAVEAEASLFHAAEQGQPAPDPVRVRRWLPSRPLIGATALALLAVGAFVGSTLAPGDRGGQRPPAARTVTGSVTDAGGGPHAQAVVIERANVAQLVLTSMAPPPRGRVYQAWVIRRKSAPAPTGTLFTIPRSGNTKASLPNLAQVERIIVTAEPPQGSRTPTPPPIVVVHLAR